ncbi:MAG: hypothetical protein Q8L66_10440 [Caulobacter sp.]|nr:hypothetical protein [Caulobacter sp.]
MLDEPNLDHLVALFDTTAIRRALIEAHRLGIEVGEQRERDRILQAVSGAPQAARAAASETPSNIVSTTSAENASTREDDQEKAPRAPRGLTRELVMLVLEDAPGSTTSEIQKRAVALDQRVSEKTVYNELNRERGRLYRQSADRWSMIPTITTATVGVEEEDILR